MTCGEKRIFGEISKVQETPEGLFVSGVLSSESRDADGELIRASALKEALPPWLEDWGNIREAHDPHKAAGKALAVETGDDGVTRIECRVVDPITAEKVRQGVLKGFSLRAIVAPGGRNAQDPTVIEKFQDVVEVSLVDRGSNPDARVEIFKSHGAPRTCFAEVYKALRGSAPAPRLDGHAATITKRAQLREVATEIQKALDHVEARRGPEDHPDSISSMVTVEDRAAMEEIAQGWRVLSGEALPDSLRAARAQLARHFQ
jgi:hypothetical protein